MGFAEEDLHFWIYVARDICDICLFVADVFKDDMVLEEMKNEETDG